MGIVDLPLKNEVKYLGMHLSRRLTWAKHIKTKRKRLEQRRLNTIWKDQSKLNLMTYFARLLASRICPLIPHHANGGLPF
jgi:hypothetical protein